MGDAVVVVLANERTHNRWQENYCSRFNRPFRLESQFSLIAASRIVASFGSVN